MIKILFLIVLVDAKTVQTGVANALETCLEQGHTNCLTKSLESSFCCAYEDKDLNKECIKDYAYCSTKEDPFIFQQFTMGGYSCEDTDSPQIVTVKEFGKRNHIIKSWNWLDVGILCRIKIQADPKLNGKIMMLVHLQSDEMVDVFQ